MVFSDTSSIEAIIEQQIQDNDEIAVINTTLTSFRSEVDLLIDPAYCVSLLAKLLAHAANAAEIEHDTYSEALCNIFGVLSRDRRWAIVFANDLIRILQTLISIRNSGNFQVSGLPGVTFSSPEAIDDIIAIVGCALSYITLSNPLLLQRCIPAIWYCCISATSIALIARESASRHLLKGIAQLYPICISNSVSDPSDIELESSILLLIQSMQRSFDFDPKTAGQLATELAGCVNKLLSQYKNMSIKDVMTLERALHSLISFVPRFTNDHGIQESILRTACLLMERNMHLSWIDEYFETLSSDDRNLLVLRRKTQALRDELKEYDTVEEKVPKRMRVESSEPMDISDTDLSSVGDQSSDTVSPVVESLTALLPQLVAFLESETESNGAVVVLEQMRLLLDELQWDASIALAPYEKNLSHVAASYLVKEVMVSEKIASLYRTTLSNYLCTRLRYTLPYAVSSSSNGGEELNAMAAIFGLDLRTLCERGAHYLIAEYLLSIDTAFAEQGFSQLRKIFKSDKAPKQLAAQCRTKLTSILAMELGYPEKKQTVLNAIERVMEWTDVPKKMSLADYLSWSFLGILDKVGMFVSAKRSCPSKLLHPYPLNALEVVMSIIGENIQIHSMQLLAMFDAIGELPNMQRHAYLLWRRFVKELPLRDVSSWIGVVTRGLLGIFPRCDEQTRQDIAKMLTDLFHNCELNDLKYEDIPDIPDFEELQSLRDFVEEKRINLEISQRIKYTIEKMHSHEVLDVLSAIQTLRRLLALHGRLDPAIVAEHDQLYSGLLYLCKKGVEQGDIRRLAAECLGRLGATEPSRCNVKLVDDEYIVLNNFTDENENREFVCFLIVKQLIPAFHGASTEQNRQCVQYAIQMALRYAGFNKKSVFGNANQRYDATIRNQWNLLPAAVQTVLTPFLESSFESKWIVSPPAYPIYPSAKNYEEWLKGWYYRLVDTANNAAKPIFEACLPSIKSGNIGLALYLQPRLVLHILLSGSDADRDNVTRELISVLQTNSQGDSHDNATKQSSLQMVVIITEHCRKWMRRRQRNNMDDRQSSHVEAVKRFLNAIPNDLMAMASFSSKAYVQSLLHLELHIRWLMETQGLVTSSIYDSIRRTYAKIDDPDAMAAVFALFKRSLSLEEEILQYECMNQFEEAKACYEELLEASSSFDSNQHMVNGFFNCLRMSGDNDGMLSACHKLILRFPQLSREINAYRAEAAWKTRDWETLATAVEQPMKNTFDAMLASAMIHIRRNDYPSALSAIESARNDQIEELATVSHESYQRSHDTIFRLQMLQDLEDSLMIWQTALETKHFQPVRALQEEWRRQLEMASPSYHIQKGLVDLQRAALIDLRPQHGVPPGFVNDGELWLMTGKKARKAGDMITALQAISRAECLDTPFAYIERAKWYWKNNEQEKAIHYLSSQPNLDAKATLLLAKYLHVSKSPDKAKILELCKSAMKKSPNWEKVYYRYGRFWDSLINAREVQKMNNRAIKACGYAVAAYCNALRTGSKYFYHTMPRLLTLWMLFGDAVNHFHEFQPDMRHMVESGFRSIQKTIEDNIDRIQTYQFCVVLPRLVSRLSHDNTDVTNTLKRIITKVIVAYPRTTVWALLPACESKNENLRLRTVEILSRVEAGQSAEISTVIKQARDLARQLKILATERIEHDQPRIGSINRFPGIVKLKDLDLCIPSQASLIPKLPESSGIKFDPFSMDLPRIKGFGSQFEVMRSLQAPKKITMIGTDGKQYRFLCKQRDDLRKDARMMEFCYMINTFLKKDPEARQRHLYIRTFGVVPLGEQWGLIEWINNLHPLKGIVTSEWQRIGIDWKDIFGLVKQRMDGLLPSEKERVFTKDILPRCPAVFYKWFLDNFPEPSQWLASRTRYIRTLAVMSIVGHILGLGDRHAENILFDQTNGDCVHVDVNMLFDKGQSLQVPEVVPFRLTKNLIDAMGILKYEGTFRKSCELTLSVLRQNKIQLLSVFETLVHDPIVDWQTRKPSRPQVQQTARKEQEKIERKIEGTPEYKSVEDAVDALIKEATSERNLSQMFIGWAAYI